MIDNDQQIHQKRGGEERRIKAEYENKKFG
jgi:hypothetical protein